MSQHAHKWLLQLSWAHESSPSPLAVESLYGSVAIGGRCGVAHLFDLQAQVVGAAFAIHLDWDPGWPASWTSL